MQIKHLTGNQLLNDVANGLLSIFLGMFMLIILAILTFKVIDAKTNMDQVARLGEVREVRMHLFDGLDFTQTEYGVARKCVVLEGSNLFGFKDVSGESNGSPFCENVANEARSWERYAPTKKMGLFEQAGWTILIGGVLFAGLYLIMRLPAIVAIMIAPALSPFVRVIAIVLALPVMLFVMILLNGSVNADPGYWTSPDFGTVRTQKVFLTRDGHLYNAPATLYDWSDPNVGDALPSLGKFN